MLAIGPPAWPLTIDASAALWRSSARWSTMRPTLQLPSIMLPGVLPTTMNLRPSSFTSSKAPRSTSNAMAKTQLPWVDFLSPLVAQGHRKSQLQVSM